MTKLNRRRWVRNYRARMHDGLEYCRQCKTREDLTLERILPGRWGGTYTLDNVTILCAPCNERRGHSYRNDYTPVSLAVEESWGPAEERWSLVGVLGDVEQQPSGLDGPGGADDPEHGPERREGPPDGHELERDPAHDHQAAVDQHPATSPVGRGHRGSLANT